MSAFPPKADIRPRGQDVCFGPILLQKLAITGRSGWRELVELAACHPCPDKGMIWHHCHRTLHSLCKAHFSDRRWSDDEPCEPTKVLRECGHCELELGTARPTHAQTTEPKDAHEMCKQHLNAFAITARSFECFGLGQRSGYVTRFLVDAALESAPRRLWTALRLKEAAAAIACLSPVV